MDTSPNAGILPYTFVSERMLFLMGHDIFHDYGDTWSDFGGRGEIGETTKMTAAREANEESGMFVGKFSDEKLKGVPYLCNVTKYTMYFVKVKYQSLGTEDYYRAISNIDRNEMDELAWVDAGTLLTTLKDKQTHIPGLGDRIKPPLLNLFLNQQTLIGNDCGLTYRSTLEWLEEFIKMKRVDYFQI